jgi:hypothetical protein
VERLQQPGERAAYKRSTIHWSRITMGNQHALDWPREDSPECGSRGAPIDKS